MVRDQEAITSHFDVSNEFYELWLDSRMLYTCASFQNPDNNLDTAHATSWTWCAAS